MTDNKKTKTDYSSVPEAQVVVENEKRDWGVGRIFWGLLLVIVGGLIFFDNLELVEVNWNDLWRLWPLIIIATGISILSLRNVIWRIVSILLIALTLGAIVWVMVGDYPGTQILRSSEISVQKTSDAVKQAEVSIKTGASSLKIDTANQNEIVKSKLESNIANISEKSTVSSGIQQISLAMDTNRSINWWTGNVRSSWTVSLTRNLPLKLIVDAGASATDIDVSKAQLQSATIKIGASSLTLKLGDKEDAVNVNLDSGVSSITIRVPEKSGVRLRLESGLTSKNIADLDKVSENTYQSSGYDGSEHKINIDGEIGVSSFTIERY